MQIEGGTVSLNLRQIVADLANRLGLPAGIAEKLPASVANLKVVTSSQLGLVRNGAKALHALAVWLTILVFALYVLALFLARGYRRRTLMWVGSSLVFAGLLVILGRKIGQGQLVSAITSDASIEPAANDAYSVATSLLVQVASASIIIGIPVILAALFAGPGALGGRRSALPGASLPRAPRAGLLDHRGAARAGLHLGPDPGDAQPAGRCCCSRSSRSSARTCCAARSPRSFPTRSAVSMRAAFGEYAHVDGREESATRACYAAPATAPPAVQGRRARAAGGAARPRRADRRRVRARPSASCSPAPERRRSEAGLGDDPPGLDGVCQRLVVALVLLGVGA